MPRRKKRASGIGAPKSAKKKPEIFNSAFKDLVLVKKERKARAEPDETKSAHPIGGNPDESAFFLKAMSDVQPLASPKKTVIRVPDVNIRPSHPAPDDELEGIAHLSDLVSGVGEFDISFSDEYIEGSVPGFNRKLMRKLKQGKFPIQDHVDLHGLTKQEAETKVRDFLIQSHRLGLRCILVVHGRGLNSENHIPVLKERLPIWLRRGPVRKIVLAFSTAKPYDGGTGAIYVLLRKRR